jgi:uncharacterized membrane protein
MNSQKSAPTAWEQKTVKTTKRLRFWTLAWVLTMALATFGPKFIWEGNEPLTIVGIIVNLLIGLGMILANKHHLRSLDDLHQKVHLEAMALALGLAVVVGLAYSNLDIAKVIDQDAEISHLVLLIGVTYLTSVVVGLRRYR